jgi:26S proteasome regulatory subunit N10
MRNGDYIPTRMEAQHDAANLICGAKTQQNPENTVSQPPQLNRSLLVLESDESCTILAQVGVLTMAHKGVELLVSPTDDMGKLLSCLHNVKVSTWCP